LVAIGACAVLVAAGAAQLLVTSATTEAERARNICRTRAWPGSLRDGPQPSCKLTHLDESIYPAFEPRWPRLAPLTAVPVQARARLALPIGHLPHRRSLFTISGTPEITSRQLAARASRI